MNKGLPFKQKEYTKRRDSNEREAGEFNNWIELIEHRALKQAEGTAFIFPTNDDTLRVSYGELCRRSRIVGSLLQARGAKNERVLLACRSGPQFLVGFFGCLYAGAVAVPVAPHHGQRGISILKTICADAQPGFGLIDTRFDRVLGSFVKNVVHLQWNEMDELSSCLEDCEKPTINESSLAYLQYTSGSTANPKGVMLSHGNLLSNSRAIRDAFEHTPCSKGVGWLPLYHDMGLVGNILQPLYAGFPSVNLQPETFLSNPVRWLQAISEYQATTSGGPNFAYELCVERINYRQRRDLDLSSWQVAFNGAEVVRAETIRRFSEYFRSCGFDTRSFLSCYGLAESTLFVAGDGKNDAPRALFADRNQLAEGKFVAREPYSDNARGLVSCGRADDTQKLMVVDPATSEPREQGQVGEIWLSGPSVSPGYWSIDRRGNRRNRLTFVRRSDGRYLRTGDLGFVYKGKLYVTGRMKDLIIIRGLNHYAEDIEATVENCHPVLRTGGCAAISTDGAIRERLIVVAEIGKRARGLVSDEKHSVDNFDENQLVVSTIRAAVSSQHQIEPDAVCLVRQASLPRTTSGKIKRTSCKIRYLDQSLRTMHCWTAGDDSREAPSLKRSDRSTSIQAWIVNTLGYKLGVEPSDIDVDRPLTDYVKDSLELFNLSGELAEWMKLDLPATLLWSNPTIASVTDELASLAGGHDSSLAPFSNGDHDSNVDILKLNDNGAPILWGVHAAGGIAFLGKLSRHLSPNRSFYAIQGRGLSDAVSTDVPFHNMYDVAGQYVDEMLRIQAEDPFYLCGLYAPIVLEVGQQLLARGKDVVSTIIFDVRAPGPQKTLVRTKIKRYLPAAVVESLKPLRMRSVDDTEPQDVVNPLNSGELRAKSLNRHLARDYSSKYYPKPIIYIRSELWVRKKKQEYETSWRAISKDVRVHVVPGTHRGMFESPHVSNLGQLIDSLLDGV